MNNTQVTATNATSTKAPRKGAKVHVVKAGKAVDVYTASYNLKAWPRKVAGSAPTRDHIIMAAALNLKVGSKQCLAVAAYMRDDAAAYSTEAVAHGLVASYAKRDTAVDPMLNVVNIKLMGPNVPRPLLITCDKLPVEGKGTAYVVRLTKRGEAKLAKYRLDHGLGEPDRVSDPVGPDPVGDTATGETVTGDAASAA